MAKVPTPDLFENPQIPEEALPNAEELDWHPLHSRFVRRLQVGTGMRVAVVAGVGAAIHSAVASGAPPAAMDRLAVLLLIAWGGFALLSAWALAWPTISVPRRGYAVREHDILYRSGVLWRSVRAIPFNRVQHTKTDSTPLDRRFGLANLSVFPAGGGAHKVRGLGAETAERLRAFVSARIEAEGTEGVPADDGVSTAHGVPTDNGVPTDDGPMRDSGDAPD